MDWRKVRFSASLPSILMSFSNSEMYQDPRKFLPWFSRLFGGTYGLELVLKTNSTENWYGWTKECCLSVHDSGPSQLAWCKPDNQHLQSAETGGNIPLVTRSQDIIKMKGEVERSILSPQNGFFLFFFFSLLLVEHLLFIYTWVYFWSINIFSLIYITNFYIRSIIKK